MLSLLLVELAQAAATALPPPPPCGDETQTGTRCAMHVGFTLNYMG